MLLLDSNWHEVLNYSTLSAGLEQENGESWLTLLVRRWKNMWLYTNRVTTTNNVLRSSIKRTFPELQLISFNAESLPWVMTDLESVMEEAWNPSFQHTQMHNQFVDDHL